MFLLFDGLKEGILKLIILMVAGIYKLVSGIYQIFLVLAKTNLFGQESYQHLTEKVYIILAVTMLFVVAYTFITMIVDPDKNKGGKAVEDLIKKVVTSLILIVLCPTLFTFAFDLQDAIMDQDIIGKFFTTSNIGYDAGKSIKEGGNMMAGTTFAAFFYPAYASRNAENIINQSNKGKMSSGDYSINCAKGKCTLQEAIDYATHTGEFSVFTAFAGNWLNDDDEKVAVDFSWLLALIAGGYLVYVLISFCFDLALRVIKLAFYQIVAPICIACRILPDKESIFKNWWKAVGKTYLSVFVRIFIMNLAVFLLVELTKTNFWSSLCDPAEMECGGVVKTLAFAFLVMGLLTFIKQSSKLIDEIFGLGDVKLGIADKLREGGAFTAGAALGAGVTTTARNITHTAKNVGKADGFKGKASALVKGLGQTASGAVRGTYDGAKSGWNAKSYSDMKAAAGSGAKQAIEKRDEMETYREAHDLGPIKGSMPVVGGLAIAAGKLRDAGDDIARWAGRNNLQEIEQENADIKAITDQVDAITSDAKKLLQSKADGGKTFNFGTKGKTTTAASLQKANSKVAKDVALSLQTIRNFDDMIKVARETGKAQRVDWLNAAAGVEFTAAELERIKGKYMADYSKVVGETALMSENTFKSTKETEDWAIEEESAFADLRAAGDKAKKTLRRVVGTGLVQEANKIYTDKMAADGTPVRQDHILTVDMLEHGDVKITGDAAFDKIVHVGNKVRSENQIKINDIVQKEKDKKGKKD